MASAALGIAHRPEAGADPALREPLGPPRPSSQVALLLRERIDRRSALPLHRQLRREMIGLIREGHIGADGVLPSTRALAGCLGVNRLTILKAYQAMRRAGVVGTSQGGNYFVLGAAPALVQGQLDEGFEGALAPYEIPFESAYSETVRSAIEMPLSFAVGYPDRALLPIRQVRRIFLRLSESQPCYFEYQSPWGHPVLRDAIWRYLQTRGILRKPGRDVLVTNGAQHALDIIARALPRRTSRAAVESPTYYGALAVLRVNGYRPLPVRQDTHGLSLDSFAALCAREDFDFLYTNPTFNNPTGMTLPLRRRQALTELLRTRSFLVVEDDTYADLGFGGAQLPTLLSLDETDRVLHIGSFSKSFMSGLRMGYIVGPRTLLAQMADLHGVNEMCSSTLSQLVLAEALQSGVYERHVRRVRAIYHRRSRVMNEVLQREMPPGCRFSPPRGGFFCWVRIPGCIDERELKARCNAAGVDYASGPQFSCDGHGGNYMRLNFTLLDEERIRTGIGRLAGEIRALLQR